MDNTHAARLKRLKEQTRFSWTDIARAFGVAPGTVYHWVYGQSGMSTASARLLEVFEGNRKELEKWSGRKTKRKPKPPAKNQFDPGGVISEWYDGQDWLQQFSDLETGATAMAWCADPRFDRDGLVAMDGLWIHEVKGGYLVKKLSHVEKSLKPSKNDE